MAIFGPSESGAYSRADVERKRKLAEALRSDSFQAREPFGALAKALTGARSGFEDTQAAEGEKKGNQIMADLLKSGDWQGAMGSEWATPQNLAMASLLQGREWEVGDRNASWAREDARAAAAAAQPDWQTIESGGDILRYNAKDPNSRPEMFFDGPEAAVEPVVINGQLVNPQTGARIGDFRDEPKPGFRALTPEEKAAAGLPPDVPAQVGPDGKIDVISGGGAGATPPSGYRTTPEGDLQFIPGGPADPATKGADLTQAEQRNQQLATVIEPELATVEQNWAALTDAGNQLKDVDVGGSRPGRAFTTPEYQQAINSLSTIVASYLYSVSGATATDEEIRRQVDLLTPKIGESQESAANKLDRIKTYARAVTDAAGGAAAPPPASSGGWSVIGVE
jgi:hypothetical protein